MDRVIKGMTLFPNPKQPVAKLIYHISIGFALATEDINYKTFSQFQLPWYIVDLQKSYHVLPLF